MKTRPILLKADISTFESITLAEREIDDVNSRNRRRMQEWWDTLTFIEQCQEWKNDDQLRFYVSNPLK